jgi:hypothetical protein
MTYRPQIDKVDSDDTTADFLVNKLVPGANVTITKNNAGAVETLTIASSTADPFAYGSTSELTLASDAATVTKNFHTLKAESGTADNLATLNGGVNYAHVILQAKASHTITVKNSTGNVYLNGATDFILTGDKTLALFFDGTNWSDTAASGGDMSDPTTTEGDLLYRHSGSLARFGIGMNGQVFTSNGTGPFWQTPTTAIHYEPLVNKNVPDLIFNCNGDVIMFPANN